jgi:hypothetical protein
VFSDDLEAIQSRNIDGLDHGAMDGFANDLAMSSRFARMEGGTHKWHSTPRIYRMKSLEKAVPSIRV